MNYGKDKTSARVRQISQRKGRVGHHFLLVFSRTILISLLVLLVIAGLGGVIYIRHLIQKLPDTASVNISPSGFKSVILDQEGHELDSLAASGANRTYVTIDKIPDSVQKAFIAIEDERFYSHHGVDYQGLMRALVTGLLSGGSKMQGASTITQQLLKNNYFTGWTAEQSLKAKFDRKIQEQVLATRIEQVTSKDIILENYLNTINLGQSTLGVEAASQRYFGKSVSDLNLSESAVLAATTKNPTRYNPITNPDQNAGRRKLVLNYMLKDHFIDDDAYKAALEDDVYPRIAANNEAASASRTVSSYFTDALTDQVIQDLVDQAHYSEAEAYKMLYSGGLTIYSTQDAQIQKIADEEVNEASNYSGKPKYSFSYRLTVTKADKSNQNYSDQTMLSYYRSSNPNYNLLFANQEAAQAAIDQYKKDIMEEGDSIAEGNEKITFTLQPQVAVTVMDQSDGRVLALVGGRGDKTGSKTLNRASKVTRQPGSTFKILAAYAPALDAAGKTLATVQDDAPYKYKNGSSLQNADRTYRGMTTYREAIVQSINIVTVKALTEIGTDLGFQYIKKFGFSTISDKDNTQALAIGGITYGVTNMELTAAYAAIANKGSYIRPHLYSKVLDRDGKVLLSQETPNPQQVIKPTTAWLLTNAMQDVMTRGTGKDANIKGITLAGKTGTTNDERDYLMEGYSGYYTVGLWGGYDDNSPQTSSAYSKKIWKRIMSRIHEGKSDRSFDMPQGITQASVCSVSGKLPLPSICNADPRGSKIIKEYFAEGTVPTDYCDRHVKVDIDIRTGKIAASGTPADQIVSGIFIKNGSAHTPDAAYAISSAALDGTAPSPKFQFEMPAQSDTQTEEGQASSSGGEGSPAP